MTAQFDPSETHRQQCTYSKYIHASSDLFSIPAFYFFYFLLKNPILHHGLSMHVP